MEEYIKAQWGLYIEYMREILDYNIIIIPMTIIPLTVALTVHVLPSIIRLSSYLFFII
jgi:hypothetical protein